ncbi:hypothetical protein EDC01DRAFT_618501, partial [Geopyxis carbonaria]
TITMATATSSVASATAPPTSSAGRPQLKSSISGTAGAGNRRSVQSPVDGSQRRNSSHKGWQTNAAQQKYNGSAIAPSSSPTPGQAANSRTRPASMQVGESDTHDKHMHDRLLFVLANLMGRHIIVTVKTGARYSGVLTGADTKSDLACTLKWTKLMKAPFGENDEKHKVGDYIGGGSEKVMIFGDKDVVDIQSSGVILSDTETSQATQQNGVSSGTFKTDADISGNMALRERELHKWQPDESADSGLSLEEQNAGRGQGWNQFEANERLFGVTSDFDENIYTTQLDRSHPQYQQREAKAAKIAAEIEGSTTAGVSAHVAEERGHAPDDSGMDEEDKYSGVQRALSASNNPNKYTPPARRAPTGQPTVPGAPHDPAIIASQLVRPESLQQKQQSPIVQTSAQSIPQINEDSSALKSKDRPALPSEVTGPRLPSSVTQPANKSGESPQIEKEISLNFKNFVSTEKERVKKKRSEMAHRDRESKLRELKKFSESFTLKTEVPQDLVPILAKDKQKQAEIIEKAKHGSKAVNSNSMPAAPANSQMAMSGSQAAGNGLAKVLPPHSFAAKDPEAFQRQTKLLLQNFPRLQQPQTLGQNVRQVHQDRNLPVRAPVPMAEPARSQQHPPTGPAANNMQNGPALSGTGPASHAGITKKFNVNARPFEFKPNPGAAAFTPSFNGPSSTASPTSAHAPVASRATSPSVFFGNKRIKTEGERPSIKDNFNPFKAMKTAEKKEIPQKHLNGNANDYIDKPWNTTPLWYSGESTAEKSYKNMFAKIEFDQSVHSPQPPHIMPPQPHHQQLPPHMPHISHPPHVPHQAHHGPMQAHLLQPHYEQDHMRQMSSPSSVMPSPSLHNATVAYQQSPVPHQSQLAMYPGPQGQMGHYGVPGAPGGPQYFYSNQAFRGAGGPGPMMMSAPQGPVPYPAGQMMHPQMYSPQQPQAYLSGPPPTSQQGFPSPGRPAAPMMMHQGSSQGTSAGPQMVAYGMQPGQNYGAQGQQQQMGMMRGQPPPHQGGHAPPPQGFYGPPQGHYPPGGRGNGYGGPQQGGQHGMPPPMPQQVQPPPQQPQGTEAGEESK